MRWRGRRWRRVSAGKWSAQTSEAAPPSDSSANKASTWQSAVDKASSEKLLARACPRDAARLHAAVTEESASLFRCLPYSKDETRLPDAAFSCAVDLRLGTDVAMGSTCVWGGRLDPLGDHALSCGRGTGRHARHKEIKARIFRALAEAGISATLEPVGLDLSGRNCESVVTSGENRALSSIFCTFIHYTVCSWIAWIFRVFRSQETGNVPPRCARDLERERERERRRARRDVQKMLPKMCKRRGASANR